MPAVYPRILIDRLCSASREVLGDADEDLVRFVISLYELATDKTDFAARLAEMGGEFPAEFVDRCDILINEHHPDFAAVKVEDIDAKVLSALSLPNRSDRTKREDVKREGVMIIKKEEPKEVYGSDSLDPDPVLDHIYSGVVSNLTDFGAFIRIRVKHPVDGLCHISALANRRIEHPSEVLTRNQQVYVKVVKIDGRKYGLSMKNINQDTGEEEAPRGRFEEVVRPKRRLTSPERWELRQLIASGAVNAADHPELVEDVNAAFAEEMEEPDQEEVHIELNKREPAFLAGQTKESLHLDPIRVVKNPEGSMSRAAMNGSVLAKERRDKRIQDAKDEAKEKARDDPLVKIQAKETANMTAAQEWRRKQATASYGKRTDLPMQEQRRGLPVYKMREELLAVVRANQFLVIVGETGSGKTTQITQYLAEEGFGDTGIIACTQPRRVAAVSVAKRVAEEVGCKVGAEVGYSVRFENETSEATKIKYMTDGMLQQEAIVDPNMSRYSVVMLDEAHERTIATDVLFALLKDACARRPDLKIIVTSATLDSDKFSKYFNDCPVVTIPGRTFPVEVMYTREPEADYLQSTIDAVMQIHMFEPVGDILVFLTGQEEIEASCETLYERVKALGSSAPELIILPVYSALSSEMQSKIFEETPSGARKVVLATNIAETSITIDGIFYVVDPGFVKINAYDAKLGMDSLVVSPISQAQANQRAGRAGRTGPGKCYRLYTESAFKREMLPNTVPEIQRTNLTYMILMLKVMGINDLLHFEFMDPPPASAMIMALEELFRISALDDDGFLTPLGRKMADFPMEPTLAKTLIASVEHGCSEEILSIVSLLSVQTIFYRPKDKQEQADKKKARFHHPHGDHLTFLNVYNAYLQNGCTRTWCQDNFIQDRSMKRVLEVRRQLVAIMKRSRHELISCGARTDSVRKALVAGFFKNTAKKSPTDPFYQTLAENTPVYMHPSSALFGKTSSSNGQYVLYHTLLLTTKEYMHCVTVIDPKWLVALAPTFFKVAESNTKKQKIVPLFNRHEKDQDAWRLSRGRGTAEGQ
ncbi:hypothetical protein BABINDRAFT_36500 [Babjeviella inositovora NRRL Y-12698]|uniref:RNA helicase n=1 Tax=Babjeviella inositovora NRRL Y-12698 TaxID=984486 RepID=A0A1E3QQH8_9ASCO|nr:uncharacterized protein BABINDRAFT_36500 [Babjeviella inositovora NRRL Y-12698]ODQ79754.1 hypothetical protein BABINDRAFT_36500 [Babjeviella inositovora NRRL Y-12698]